MSLLQGSESGHGRALSDFITWCEDNYLDLNVTKTKDMIIDFRKKRAKQEVSIINKEEVEIIDTYRYLGTIFDSDLKFDKNMEVISKKGQQPIYLLRKLNSFNVSKPISSVFYRSFIESLLTFSFISWFHGLSVKNKNTLSSIVGTCARVMDVQTTDLHSLWSRQVLHKAKSIIAHSDHVLTHRFVLMPSGRRYLTPSLLFLPPLGF